MSKKELVIKFIKNLKGFDKDILSKFKILTADNGNCTGTLLIEDEHTNPMGGLHGGLSATLIDSISSYALMTHEKGAYPSVSVNINASYMKGAKKGDEILIDAKTLKVGNQMAFLDVEIRNNTTGDILVKGEHTKFILK